MGILSTPSRPAPKAPLSSGKRASMQDDFSRFKPLSSNGLKNFSDMRDPGERNRRGDTKDKAGKRRQLDEDSDEDVDIVDDVLVKAEDTEDKDADRMLSPEEARKQGELADGLGRIRVGGACSLEPRQRPSLIFTSSMMLTVSYSSNVNTHLTICQPALPPLRPISSAKRHPIPPRPCVRAVLLCSHRRRHHMRQPQLQLFPLPHRQVLYSLA